MESVVDIGWSGVAGENTVDLAIADRDEDGLGDLAVASHATDPLPLSREPGAHQAIHADTLLGRPNGQ